MYSGDELYDDEITSGRNLERDWEDRCEGCGSITDECAPSCPLAREAERTGAEFMERTRGI